MDNVKNMASRLDSSRIVVIVSVVYVVLITAIGMYLYMKFNEKERFDRRFIKRLEDHTDEPGSMYISTDGFHNPNAVSDSKKIVRENQGNLISPVSIVNCHIKTAFNCCAVNTYRNSWVSVEPLKYCLQIGMKCLDFEIYSVERKPVVGLNSREKNIDMKESFNKIPLGDVISVIRKFMASTTILDKSVMDLPLILHFRLKTKQEDTLKAFAEEIAKLGDDRYGTRYHDIISEDSETCFIHHDLYENGNIAPHLKRKIIVIANFTSLSDKTAKDTSFYRDFISNTNIDSAVNLISPSKFCKYTTNTNAQVSTNDDKPSIDPFELTFSAPFADFEGSCIQFNPSNVQESGVQLIGICAQKNLEKNNNSMVNGYFNLFSDGKARYYSYIAKSNSRVYSR